jgi:hypothetical protein
MTFEQWQNRPVYKTQVHTAKILTAMMGLPKGAIATKGDHPFLYFRIVSRYRCAYSLALRKQVAEKVRESRRNGTYQLEGVTA